MLICTCFALGWVVEEEDVYWKINVLKSVKLINLTVFFAKAGQANDVWRHQNPAPNKKLVHAASKSCEGTFEFVNVSSKNIRPINVQASFMSTFKHSSRPSNSSKINRLTTQLKYPACIPIIQWTFHSTAIHHTLHHGILSVFTTSNSLITKTIENAFTWAAFTQRRVHVTSCAATPQIWN